MTDTKPTAKLTPEQPKLSEVREHFKGKNGGVEGESHLIDANCDKKDGFVWVYSNKSDAAKIIERCEGAIKEYTFLDSGVQMQIDRKAFRGITYAFRKVK